jgi:DNA repair exonuclease SbcCD nuclease subunit
MKKLSNLLAIIGVVVLATGCQRVVLKGNTLQSRAFEPSVYVTPIIADLSVTGKKVTGKAKGSVHNKAILKENAVADALKGYGDALVGANFFYEIRGRNLEVTVIGYPAMYVNFRSAGTSTTPHETELTKEIIVEAVVEEVITEKIKKEIVKEEIEKIEKEVVEEAVGEDEETVEEEIEKIEKEVVEKDVETVEEEDEEELVAENT